MKKVIRLVSLSLAIFVFLLILYLLWNMNLYTQKQDIAASVSNMDEILQNEEGTVCYAGAGDPELTDEELQSPVPENRLKRTRSEMVSLLYNSKNVIPFCEGGRYWKTEFPVASGNVGDIPDSSIGVDSLGFVMWAYYAIFHVYIDEPSQAYRLGNRINVDALQPGDIGMLEYAADTPNHYGIFLGYDEDVLVFAHCSSYPSPGFPRGGVQLCSVVSPGSEENYYAGLPAEGFRYFTRPEVVWEKGQNEISLSELIAGDPSEDSAAIKSYAEFGAYLHGEWTDGNYESIYNLLNNEIAVKRGFQVDKVQFIERAKSMRSGMTGKSIRIYNTFQLAEGTVVVRYCLVGLRIDETGKEWVADTIHCQWLDLTLYINNGGIRSFLPFNAAMFENALQFGYTKRI